MISSWEVLVVVFVVLVLVLVVLGVVFLVLVAVVACHYFYSLKPPSDHQKQHQDHKNHHQDLPPKKIMTPQLRSRVSQY